MSSTPPVRRLLLAMLIVTVALSPVIKELLFVFWTTAAYRGLVCALELGVVFGVILSSGRPLRIPLDTGRWASRLFLGWAAWSLLTVAVADHTVPAIVRQAEWFCHIAFGAALWHHLQDRPRDRRLLFALLPASMIIVTAGIGLFWHALVDPYLHPWSIDLPFFNNVRHYGYLGLGALMACLYPLIARQSWTRQAFVAAAFVICLAGLLWAGGRGALLGMAVGILTALFFAPATPKLKIAMLVVASVPLAIGLNRPFAVDDEQLGIVKLTGHQPPAHVAEVALDTMSSGRLTLWRETLSLALAHPLTGLGPDGFAYLAPPTRDSITQPHSMPVQVVSDWGIPGALLISGWFLLLGSRALTLLRADPDADRYAARVTAICTIVAYVVHGLTDGTFYHSLPMMIIALSFAIALQPNARPGDEKPRGPLDRRAALVVTTSLSVIIALHITVSAIARSETIPTPSGLSATLVRAFPSHVSAGDIGRWVEEWRTSDPAAAMDWAIWGQRHGRDPWFFAREQARLLMDAGQTDAARAALERAVAIAPERKRPLLTADLRGLPDD